ncbi:discoidin domain-containing protein, partial [Maribacter sp. 2307ULW6-5]|uniref:galactose-binding domain-containing protein n=1 Tax=Maribacter sp. 2307ULW6-5 TaxID=3386275 RepID=UPI0039BD3FB7
LRFSDGSTINVDALDNNGAARLIEFPEKTVTWVELDITNGAGANVGLSEFEVYGEYTDDGGSPPPPSENNDVNLALNQPTAQSSSSRIFIGPSSRAVDGNTDGNFNAPNGSVTHTNRDFRPWWLVDLGATYNVSDINVYNRTDCCSGRLLGAILYVGNVISNNPADYTEVGTLSESPSVQNFNNVSVRGRYVMIRHVRPSILSLAEVEVFGSLPAGTVNLQAISFGEELKEGINMLVYPNPTSGELYINLGSQGEGERASILIFGNDGRTVFKKDYGLDYGIIEILQLDFLADGVYYVQITKGDTTTAKSIIISR